MAKTKRNEDEIENSMAPIADAAFGAPADSDEDVVRFGGMNEIENKFHATPGRHEGRVIDAKKEISKSSGNDMIVLTVVCTGRMMSKKDAPTFDTQCEADGGKEFKSYFALTKAAAFKLLELGKAFDLPINESGEIEIRLSALRDKACIVLLADRIYNEETGTEIKKILRHPDGPDGE